MSVVFSLKNLFGKKPSDEADPSVTQEMSLGTQGPNTANIEAGSTQNDTTIGDDSISEEVDEAELISVPILGRKTAATHQRTLFALLSFALIGLGGVAFFAVNQADRIAQQVAGTGNSLMQSQRLAKSVSQALIGSPQAFPDVQESSKVLAQTVRGLHDGDASLRLDKVALELQSELNDKIMPPVVRAEKSAKVVLDHRRS